MDAFELRELDASVGDRGPAADLLEPIVEEHWLDGDRLLEGLHSNLDDWLASTGLAVDLGNEIDASLRAEVVPNLLSLWFERSLEIFIQRNVRAAQRHGEREPGFTGFSFARTGNMGGALAVAASQI